MPVTLWQLYDIDGNPLVGKGASLWDALLHGLLHGAVHVWLWRPVSGDIEVLVQVRAANKLNWPNGVSKSAGGHILLGEDPQSAAVRKLKYELGLELADQNLELIGRHHWHGTITGTGLQENEYQWIYFLRHDQDDFKLLHNEVERVVWKPLSTFSKECATDSSYVPYGRAYYDMVCTAFSRLRENETASIKQAGIAGHRAAGR